VGERERRGFDNRSSVSVQAAILPRIRPGHEQWRSSVGPKNRVTLLVALPAIGHAFGPADAVGAAVRKHLDPNLSAVYENVRSRAYFKRV